MRFLATMRLWTIVHSVLSVGASFSFGIIAEVQLAKHGISTEGLDC